MAEAVISSVLRPIFGKLNSVLSEEFGMVRHFKTEFDNLQSTLITIKAVLEDSKAKPWTSESVKIWVKKLTRATSDASDVIDEITIEVQRQRIECEAGSTNRVSLFFSPRNPLLFRLRMAHRLKCIRQRLDAISAEKLKFHLNLGVLEIETNRLNGRQTSSLVTELEVYGRDKDIENIVEALLTNQPDQEDVPTYAIWGMGGMGKTTLAQCVYNDRRVEMHFELRIWVCVSDDFDIRRLTKAIISSIDRNAHDTSELDPLHQIVREKITGRRFLLVLDDVWSKNIAEWDTLKALLKWGAKGSVVIVTSRCEKIAIQMATLPVHPIGSLSEDDSWFLFKRYAFGTGMSEHNSDLELIGKDMVKKCGGMPLAIKALGGLMCLKSTESEWKLVKNSEIWSLADDK